MINTRKPNYASSSSAASSNGKHRGYGNIRRKTRSVSPRDTKIRDTTKAISEEVKKDSSNTLQVPTLDFQKEEDDLKKITSDRVDREQENKSVFLQVDSAANSAAVSRDSGVSLEVASQGSSSLESVVADPKQSGHGGSAKSFIPVLPPPMSGGEENASVNLDDANDATEAELNVTKSVETVVSNNSSVTPTRDVRVDSADFSGGPSFDEAVSSRTFSKSPADMDALLLLEHHQNVVGLPHQFRHATGGSLSGAVTPGSLAALEEEQLVYSGYASRRRSLEVGFHSLSSP